MTNILDKILDTKAVEVSQAKSIKEDLLSLGIDKIDIGPNPSEEILIEVSEKELTRLNLSMRAMIGSFETKQFALPDWQV